MVKNDKSRYRAWNIVFYAGVKELERILLVNLERIAHYAWIVHDKDVYSEDLLDNDGNYVHKAGELEKPHIHLTIEFYNGLSFSACKRLFTTENDKPRVERTFDKVAIYEYLTHKNDKDKYQYSKAEIWSNDIDYFEKLRKEGDKTDSDSKAIAIVEEMLANVSPRIMMARYVRDYIIHYNQYKDMCDRVREYDVAYRLGTDAQYSRQIERELEQMGLLD